MIPAGTLSGTKIQPAMSHVTPGRDQRTDDAVAPACAAELRVSLYSAAARPIGQLTPVPPSPQ